MSGRRRTATYGIVFGYAGIGIALLRNVLFVPLYLHNIPLPEYGAWLATGGALALLLINDFGLSGVVTQKASASYGAGELQVLGLLGGSSLAIGALLALSLTGLSLILLPFLPGLDSLDVAVKQRVVNCFLISVGANALGVFGSTAISMLRSLQRPVLSGTVLLGADAANIAVTLFGLFSGWGLYALAGGVLLRAVVIAAAAPIGLMSIARREIGMCIQVSASALRQLMGESARFFLSSIAMKLQLQANVLFIGAILGPTSAAVYGLTVRAHETVLMLIGQINAALVPSVTHLVGSGNRERFEAVLLRIAKLLGLGAGAALSLTILLNEDFLKLWVGAYAFVGQNVSILMGAALFTSSIGYIAYDALIAHGRFQFVTRVFAAGSVLQIVLLAAFIHVGIWVAPLVTLTLSVLWGGVFWREVGDKTGFEARHWKILAGDLFGIGLVSAVVIAAFVLFYPAASSWKAWVLEAALGSVALGTGYWSFVPHIRDVLREEAGSTLRAFRPT